MTLGIIYTLAGVFGFSLANLIQKIISLKFDISQGLIFQYFFVVFFGFFYLLFFGGFSFEVNSMSVILLILAGVFGYLGIFGLYKGFKYINTGVVLTIAFSFTFLSYFLNVYLFPNIETFSLGKMLLALIFFVTIGFLILEKDLAGKIRINKYILYPILTAVSWTIYFGIINYLVKKSILTPVQTVFYCEFAIFIICACILTFSVFLKKIPRINFSLNKTQILLYMLGSLGSFFGAVFMFYGYKHISGNLVNFISLTQVILTSILTYIFLQEKLDRNQWISIILAIGILSVFIFI